MPDIKFLTSGFISSLLLLPSFLTNYIRKVLFVSVSKEALLLEESLIDLSNYRIVITGANTGIGFQTALNLAKRGASCIIACRDESKGIEAQHKINKLIHAEKSKYPFAPHGSATYMKLDLSNLRTIVDFVLHYEKQFGTVHVLINNAGINYSGITTDNLEQLFQVNYLGHYLLFRLLQPIMTSFDSKNPARVVNLSSVMHHFGNINYRQTSKYIPNKKSDLGASDYSNSKLFLNLLTIEINKRYSTMNSPQPIIAISVNPGAVRSDIWRKVTGVARHFLDFLMQALFLTVDQGSMPSVYATIVDYETICTQRIKQSEGSRQPEAEYHLPYVIPYTVWGRSVAMEMMGPYTGPVWGRTSLPERALQVSEELWKYSEELCESILQGRISEKFRS